MKLASLFQVWLYFCFASANSLVLPSNDSKFKVNIKLYNGVEMPRLGFGTAAIRKESFQETIKTAVDNGFRLFDSAEATQWYDDKLLGDSLAALPFDRSEYFLVSKIFPTNYGNTRTRESVNGAIENLKTDYLDLVLLHFPECWVGICGNKVPEGTWKDALRVLSDLLEEGLIRALGVSNFDLPLLQESIKIYKPHVVQNWMDPFHKDEAVLQFCHENGLAYMGYSTLGNQWEHRGFEENPVFKDETIARIAKRYDTNAVEVVLKWGLQRGTVMIPRSNSIKNIVNNGKLFSLIENRDDCREDFWLSEEDLHEINILPDL